MIFALDFDDTFTKDPEFFIQMVKYGKKRGHIFYCVTMRNDDELKDVRDYLGEYVDAIINTSRAYKYKFIKDRGIKIDVWIDDNPFYITGV